MTDQNQPPKRKVTKNPCPKGHTIGKSFSGFKCSSALCGEDLAAMAGKREQDLDELQKLDPAQAEAEHRLAAARVPAGLKGDEAVKWSQDKMVELLPEAVANIAWNLRFGTAKERAEATDKVLRANGMDRRDSGVQSGGMIVLNLGGTATDIPWLKRVQPARPVVESLTPDSDKDDE